MNCLKIELSSERVVPHDEVLLNGLKAQIVSFVNFVRRKIKKMFIIQ